MISLSTGGTFKGKAGTATAITYTITGDAATTTDAFQVLGQGQLAGTTGDLLSTTPVPSSTSYLIKEILLANTTASNVTGITFYANGSSSGNVVWQGSIPASGSAVYDDSGWHVYDSNGVVQSVGSTGPSGTLTVGTVTNIGSTGPPTVTNVGTSSAAVLNFGLQQGATGSTGASGVVQDVLATDSSITIAGTTAHPTVSRSALTGDVIASAGSNVTTLAAGNAGNLNSGTLLATRMPALTGDITTSAGAVATTLVTVNTVTPGTYGTGSTVSTVTVNGKGLVTASSSTAIQSATTSQAGFESAAQFNTVANIWYDVTNYGVSAGNSGAANVAAMNTLIQTTAAGPFTFYFPPTGANYPMTGTITVTKNGQTFVGAGMRSSVIFVANTTTDLFSVTDAVANTTFQDLGFWSTATATAGSVFNCGTVSGTGNQQTNFYRIGMEGFGGNHFNGILFNGTRGGEVCNIEDCVLNSFRGWGIATVGNTTVPNTTSALTMTNVLMNGSITGTTGAIAGVYQQQAGALQLNNCDIIQCTNNLLTAPVTSTSQVVASVYAINSYFDASHGSCVKLGGTQPTVRCKFVSCSMTVSADSAANYSAIEFSNTATNPPGDVDILNCNIQNTFNNTATTNGILITSASNVKIIGNNINGFTNNIQASAAASSATKLNIVGNSFGPGTVSATASATDILLNSGTYGYIQIVGNVFAPTSPFQTTSTSHLSDASTVAAGFKNISNNIGLANPGYVPTLSTAATIQSFTASAANLIQGTSIQLPTNALYVGSKFRWNIAIKKTATGVATWTLAVKFGTANTTTDTAIASWTSGTNTALADYSSFVLDLEILSIGSGTSATCKANAQYVNSAGTTVTGLGSLGPAQTTATAFNSTLATPFLHIDITPGASAVMSGTGAVTVLS